MEKKALNTPSHHSFETTSHAPEHHTTWLAHERARLNKERVRLEQAMNPYDWSEMQSVFDGKIVSDELIDRIRDAWLLRPEANLLAQPLTDLGLTIFSSFPECQTAFPEHTLVFNDPSATVSSDNTSSATLERACAPIITLSSQRPDIRAIFFSLATTGEIDTTANHCITELVRAYRTHTASEENEVLDIIRLALRGFNNPFSFAHPETLAPRSVRTAAIQPNFWAKTCLDDLCHRIARAYISGKTLPQLETLLASLTFNVEKKRFEPRPLIVEHDAPIAPSELQDAYRLLSENADICRAQTRFALFETVHAHTTATDREQWRVASVRKHLLTPTFFKNGTAFAYQGAQYAQHVVCPVSDMYPYDAHGLRTGIAFGFFPSDREPDHAPEFAMGYWEASSDNATFTPATDDGRHATETLLHDMAQQAGAIDMAEKERLVREYATAERLHNPQIRTVLNALIDPEEWRQIFRRIEPDIHARLIFLEEQLSRHNISAQTEQRALPAEMATALRDYRAHVDTIRALYDIGGGSGSSKDMSIEKLLQQLELILHLVTKDTG